MRKSDLCLENLGGEGGGGKIWRDAATSDYVSLDLEWSQHSDTSTRMWKHTSGDVPKIPGIT